MSAWLMRSALTTGPIVVSAAWASIGPSSASRAVTISPSWPVRRQLGVADRRGGGDGDGRRAAEADGLADGDARSAPATRDAPAMPTRPARRRGAAGGRTGPAPAGGRSARS